MLWTRDIFPDSGYYLGQSRHDSKKMFIRPLPIILLFSILFTTPGCSQLARQQDNEASASILYTEDDPAQDPEMVSFIQDAIDMSIPQGWRQEDINSKGELKARFVKHDGSRLLVFCFDHDTKQTDIIKILQQSIVSAMPDATRIAGMFELDVPGTRPRFEMYQGSIQVEGITIAMDANIAWRMDDRLGGCKYGLFYAAARKQDAHNKYEFLAIARSLK